MGTTRTLLLSRHRRSACLIVLSSLLLSFSSAAQKVAESEANPAAIQEMLKDPNLIAAFSELVQEIQKEVKFPAERSQSKLLPLMPDDTLLFMALPNLGDTTHQVLTVFRSERQKNATLRSWWEQKDVASFGPKVEDSLETFYQLSQYLGDEIVISGAMKGKDDPDLLIVAETTKPGLLDFLRQVSSKFDDKSKSLRILTPDELTAANEIGKGEPFIILVRPDYLVGSSNLSVLRSFSSQLDQKEHNFLATEFGQRLAEAYHDGVAGIGAIDVQKILKQIPKSTPQNEEMLNQSGFADMKYLVWEHKSVDGAGASQMELSFNGARHGMASWLGTPRKLGSLDFMPPSASMAMALQLKNPPDIFDELKAFSAISSPSAFVSVDQMEQALGVSLRNDVLGQLTGEIGMELEGVREKTPAWKVLLQVKDPTLLQATLSTIFSHAQLPVRETKEDGMVYYIVPTPQGKDIAYAFVDNYLLIASKPEGIGEAIAVHQSGESLAKSKKFSSSLPPGRGAEASGIFFEDPMTMAALNMQRLMPQFAATLSQAKGDDTGVAIGLYAEESALREASRSSGIDAGAVMVVAAVAIPNLLRARIAANESSAVGSLRIVNVVQITYASIYPARGYARNLASLGPDPRSTNNQTAAHAGLIDGSLGPANCFGTAWCEKSGFKFHMAAVCPTTRCREYVVVATPVSASTGANSFCSTSDAVIRKREGAPLATPVTVAQCKSWVPLQ